MPLATETLNDAGNATNVARAFTRTLGKDYALNDTLTANGVTLTVKGVASEIDTAAYVQGDLDAHAVPSSGSGTGYTSGDKLHVGSVSGLSPMVEVTAVINELDNTQNNNDGNYLPTDNQGEITNRGSGYAAAANHEDQVRVLASASDANCPSSKSLVFRASSTNLP